MYNSQAGVISAVAGNTNAIGYASLSAINAPTNPPNVRMLSVNGARPGEPGYPSSGNTSFVRDFVIMVPTGVTLHARTQVFYNFLQSTEARDVIVAFDLDAGDTLTGTFDGPAQGNTAPAQTAPIQIRGSTTVTPVMERLVARFVQIVPWATQAMFDLDAGGSGQGRNVGRNIPISGAQSYISGAAIGMSSAGADNAPANGITYRLAFDTTVVIVHPQNPLVAAAAAATATARESNPDAATIYANVTIAELFAIYTGTIGNWNKFLAATA
jgi:ABC-type phosphate transport system substrate-binding protein